MLPGFSTGLSDEGPLDIHVVIGDPVPPRHAPCPLTQAVLKTLAQIAPGKIAAFAKLYPHDVRPVQPLNGRVVNKSE